MQLTRPKVIAITLLAVLAALGSASLFAQNGSSQPMGPTIQLTPTSGCPGTRISVLVSIPAVIGSAGDVNPTPKDMLTSYPDGLISSFDGSSFIVGDSVCAGDYVVTVQLWGFFSGVGNPATVESVSTHFTVGGNGCPNLRACQPVGGVVMPTNTLAITAPYLALAGLVAVVSAVVAIKRRRD
jgi:hypothetical protein